MLNIILALVAAPVIYLVGGAIYSLTFHPLADVPGPKICAISRLPYWLATFRGEDVHWMKKLHDEYGPVIRFGPTDLSYTHRQAWTDIYGLKASEKAAEFNFQPINGKLMAFSFCNVLNLTDF